MNWKWRSRWRLSFMFGSFLNILFFFFFPDKRTHTHTVFFLLAVGQHSKQTERKLTKARDKRDITQIYLRAHGQAVFYEGVSEKCAPALKDKSSNECQMENWLLWHWFFLLSCSVALSYTGAYRWRKKIKSASFMHTCNECTLHMQFGPYCFAQKIVL